LLYETPCIESIQSALRHAIWPKTIPPEVETKAEWVCYGIPQQLFLDNAWAHHSHSLENLARSIGQNGRYNSIDLIFRPPYMGRYGGLIERRFGDFSGQMKERLPGAIRSNDPKVLRRAAKEACLLYQDLYRIIYEMIVTYQHTSHRELEGLTPHQKWLEGMQLGLPMVPPLTPAIERLFWRMSPETRLINHEGINAFGLHYWSPDLAGIQRVGQDGCSLPYNFSYEPDDISRLALFRDGHWVTDVLAKELRLADGSTLSVSLWERKIARILARRDGQSCRDWLSYLYNIDEMTQRRLTEKKQARPSQTGQTTKAKQQDNLQTIEMVLEQSYLNGTQQNYTELLTDFVGNTNEKEVI
jgi:putative transposase